MPKESFSYRFRLALMPAAWTRAWPLCLGVLIAGCATQRAGVARPTAVPAALVLQVRYAGFALSGRHADLKRNYKYASQFFGQQSRAPGGTDAPGIMRKMLANQRGKATRFKLLMRPDEGDETSIAMALVLTREGVSVENIGLAHKVVVNLSFELAFIDVKGSELISSFPVRYAYVDALPETPSEEDVAGLVGMILTTRVPALIAEKLPELSPRPSGAQNMRVRTVTISPAASSALGKDASKPDSIASAVAAQFSGALSSTLGVSLLPYIHDNASAKMTLVFEDASVQDFRIPEASYSIDLSLEGFSKREHARGQGVTAFLYGAFIKVRIYDESLGTVYWDKLVKQGAFKKIPDSQSAVDDAEVMSEMLEAVISRAALEMGEDKKVKQEVLRRCTSG